MTPHDLYTGDLLSTRATLASGVTTIQDVSDIQNTPEHSDALVTALREPGIRAVFAYGMSLPRILAHGTLLPDDARRRPSRPRPVAGGFGCAGHDGAGGGGRQR